MINILAKYIIQVILESIGVSSIKIMIKQSKSISINNKINVLLLLTILLIASIYLNMVVNYAIKTW